MNGAGKLNEEEREERGIEKCGGGRKEERNTT